MIIPTKRQYQKWGLLSKITFWSFILTIFGIILTLMLWYLPSSSIVIEKEDLKNLYDVVNVSRILEGSPLCCEIKTSEVIVILPEEKEITLSAEIFIGLVPDTADQQYLSYAFSIDKNDTIIVFGCNRVGQNDLNIYFFRRNTVFCAKPAILDLRDPDDNCEKNIPKKTKRPRKSYHRWPIRFYRF